MATIAITTAAQREKLEDRLGTIEAIQAHHRDYLAHSSRLANMQAMADAALAKRDALDAKLRRGAVREHPALDGLLENPVTVPAVERDGEGVIINLLSNAEAIAFLGL